MPARNAQQWGNVPGKIKSGEYVDSRIYSDRDIFEEELTKIWRKVWIPVCHESEVPEPYSFRTMTIAREPVIVVKGPDNKVRAFLNVCPHRGNMIENKPSGSFKKGSPPDTTIVLTYFNIILNSLKNFSSKLYVNLSIS